MTSDALIRPPQENDTVAATAAERGPGGADGAAPDRVADRGDRDRSDGRSKLSLPLVPVLATLLVLLVGAGAFLWSTRPESSVIGTEDYVEALQAARSGVVDLTSFDHLTLDDDIEQIRRVTTGDLREESVAELEDNRELLVDSEAIVNTEVVGAGVTRADSGAATVLMVIQATQESTASPQAQVVRYRVQVDLTKEGDRWVLSGIAGR